MQSIEIVVGTYENVLIGFRVVDSLSSKENYTLETSFTDDSHRGALKCVCVSPNGILASTSTDDSVRLHSLKRRKEIGSLFQHSGTVNAVRFFGKGNMFSASDDGTIGLWKTKNWELLRSLKGHKAKVLSMCVHPSGKLGLSVGIDKGLLTWDLLTGKLAFQRKLKEVVESIMFSSTGNHYILQFQRRVDVCSLEDTKTVTSIPLDWRINCSVLLSEKFIVLGGEHSCVLIIDIFSGEQIFSLDTMNGSEEAFSSRVKGIQVSEGQDDTAQVFVGLANGKIQGFEIDLKDLAAKPILRFNYDSGVRLTCMTVFQAKDEAQITDQQDEKMESSISEETKLTKSKKSKKKIKEKALSEQVQSENTEVKVKASHMKTKKQNSDVSSKKKLKRQSKDQDSIKFKAKKHKAGIV